MMLNRMLILMICSVGVVVSELAKTTNETLAIDVLSGNVAENVTNKPDVHDTNCTEQLVKCYNGTTFTPIHSKGPIHADPYMYSNLIRFIRSHKTADPHVPLELDENLLQHLSLLYNNTDQLRVLLTLMRSDREKDWITIFGGYGECDDPEPIVFTCVNNVCSQNNVLTLNYTNDLFTEDVLGLELSPPNAFVLVLVRNEQTREQTVLRIPTESMSLLDATYNLVRLTLASSSLDPCLSETLSAYRRLFPSAFPSVDAVRLSIRHHSKLNSDDGPATVDDEKHRHTRR